jgi:signal transduction histidine kinase/ActR/RegA family two-component response regulator
MLGVGYRHCVPWPTYAFHPGCYDRAVKFFTRQCDRDRIVVENLETAAGGREEYIHKQWKYLSEHSPQALVALEGPSHIVRYANPAFARLAGEQAQRMIGRPFAMAVPQGLGEGSLALLDRVFRTGQAATLNEAIPSQQTLTYWSFFAWAVPGHDRLPAGVLLQVADATQSTLSREKTVAVNEALVISATQMHELAEVQESVEARDRFIAVLSHEIRNPLNALSTGLHILKAASDDTETVQSCVGVMERQISQMTRLLDDLLDINRYTTGQLEIHKQRVDIATVVRDAVALSQRSMDRGGHALHVTLPGDPIMLSADPDRLGQVLQNLLANAVKFSEPGDPVELEVAREGDDVVIRIRDRGIGIPAAHLPRIFEIFQQVDTEWKRAQGGLGIGLSLARKFVELHGGQVVACSEGSGKGSEFIVRLPADRGSPAAGPAPEKAARARARARRILLVEDNVDAANALAALLEIMQHEVRTAHDGGEGVAVAAKFRPEVILMDLGMPKMDGFEAVRRIRAQPWGREPMIIALTGWGSDEDQRRTRQAGFDRHLVKPVNLDVLVPLIDELTSKPH